MSPAYPVRQAATALYMSMSETAMSIRGKMAMPFFHGA